MQTAPLPQSSDTSLQIICIKPFENIALAFSGGGFKAASFALGVLSYLNNLKFDEADPLNGTSLLQQVTYMSSASGGTIAAALYALNDAEGKTFPEFYVKLFNALDGEHILKNALEILSDKRRWKSRPDKSRNIINAFAIAYDEYIFDGETLQALSDKNKPACHLQEVCFNSTEFYTGMSFRQETKMAYDAMPDIYFKFGNENIFIEPSVANGLKLSDLLAASSCFPAGFEPIIFPNDFAHSGLTSPTLKQALTMRSQTGDKKEAEFIAKKRVGFMDGGITDNQGLQSLMYADRRRIRQETDFKPFNLMLINDVGSQYISPYVMPEALKKGGLSLKTLNLIVIICLIAAIAITIAGVCMHNTILTVIGGVLIPIPLLSIIGVLWMRNKIFKVSKEGIRSGLLKNFTENIVALLVKYFTKTPLPILKQMLQARIESVLMLNLSVFLKRIRQLLYNSFYGSPEWKNRGKGNHIYDLSFSNDINRGRNPLPPFMAPSRDIQIVAQVAFNMGTTLWFDSDDNEVEHYKACIIACGQFTTCYNLLEYIERLIKNPSAYDTTYQGRLNKIRELLLNDYNHFKTDPFFMYNNAGRDYKIENFKPLTMKDIPFPKNWE